MRKSPNKKNPEGFSLIEMMVVVAILAILLAVAVPYYMAYKKTACDRAAQADIHNFSACLERFQVEVGDMNCNVSNFETAIDIGWFTGPYYGWGGTNNKCSVVLRQVNDEVWSCAMHGSEPTEDAGVRYVYRTRLPGGVDLPATRGECWGKRYGGPNDKCYTSSIIQKKEGDDCILDEPKGSKDCGKILGAD